jgi:hypothetical protein
MPVEVNPSPSVKHKIITILKIGTGSASSDSSMYYGFGKPQGVDR